MLVFFALTTYGQQSLDERAKGKYSEAQIASMSPEKIAQVNFYYSKSFEVKRTDKCNTCPDPDPSDIDITVYENQRQPDRRVGIMEEKGRYRVILLSHTELSAAYDRIMNEYNSKK